jgi:hypothetical protein
MTTAQLGHALCNVCMYVCRLLHIGRIRMDMTTQGYLGPRQNARHPTLVCCDQTPHRSASSIDSDLHKSIPRNRRAVITNLVDAGLIAFHSGDRINTPSPIPWVFPVQL